MQAGLEHFPLGAAHHSRPGAPVPNTNTPSATSPSTSPSSQTSGNTGLGSTPFTSEPVQCWRIITSGPDDTLLFLGASPSSSANILDLKTSSSSPPSQAQRLVSSVSTLGGVASFPSSSSSYLVPLPYPLPNRMQLQPLPRTPHRHHQRPQQLIVPQALPASGSGECTDESTGFENGFTNGWCGGCRCCLQSWD